MKLLQTWGNEAGASAVEFALTLPVFSLMLFAAIEGGLLMWSQLGLQHGAEMAARCASVNTSICGSASDIQKYAAQQTYGVNPPASVFAVNTSACGNQVSASYAYRTLTAYFGVPSLTLTARSCFPTK
jgi:Flp pilus assembly protein TadG